MAGVLASQVSSPTQTPSRPTYEFPPDIWGNRLSSIPCNQDQLEWYDMEVEMLKCKVDAMLKDPSSDAVERTKLIDLICRLGVSYHFQVEIERQLHQIFHSQPDLLDMKDYDLYTVATVFRVFRQHGMKISYDTFNRFKDCEKGKFKDSLANDPKGLLSLFEAAHLSTNGEEILDEALIFTRTHLKPLVHSKSEMADEIASSLITPLHKAPPRLKAREFISFYEKRPHNDTLLKFAKLDFNRVQLLHQQEIRSLYKWSREEDLASKLPFARHRIIEFFFWGETVFSEPHYACARAEYTKQCNLLTFLDDIYDTYGTFDDLPSLTDAMQRFKYSEKGKYKDSLANDPDGLLSLFEAAHLSTHGEEILDEALNFTMTHLEQLARSKSEMADEIASSLITPLHKAPPRLKAREFISFYEKRGKNDTLLKFAKLDFNQVQLLHQQEIRSLYKWSKEQDLATKLPFARDRIIEFFCWGETVYFEPHYAYGRAEYTKQCNLVTFLDDIYDTYCDFEDLPILTDAMQRWDRSVIDQLPKEYMKHLYKIYLDTFDELQSHASRAGTSLVVSLTREYVSEFARCYMKEAEWVQNGYVPSFEDSLELGIITAGKRMIRAFSFMGMGELGLQAIQWTQNAPDMAEATAVISRLTNELVSSKREEGSGNVTKTWTCYKRDYKTSDEETIAEFRRRNSSAWKIINEELMRESSNVPLEILVRVINYARAMEVVYRDQDLLTDVKCAESCIKTLYFDPIPL